MAGSGIAAPARTSSLGVGELDRALRRHFERGWPRIGIAMHRSLREFRRELDADSVQHRYRVALEAYLVGLTKKEPQALPGICRCCGQVTSFALDMQFSDGREPNLRERLNCAHCGLSNRLRLSMDVFQALLPAQAGPADVYLTEQGGPAYDHLMTRCRLVGSEFVDAERHADVEHGHIHHEDLAALSFADSSFDTVLSFDRLEHVPDPSRALAEFFRVLKPGGRLMLTAPFDINGEANLQRAVVETDGRIRHLVPPDLHVDPLDPQGTVLCYWWFGWELLKQLRQVGFSDAVVLTAWSAEAGYLGHWVPLIIAVRTA